jgi:glycine dehydrogenase subunit 1
MLAAIGVDSTEDLFRVIPEDVRNTELRLPAALCEQDVRRHMKGISSMNVAAEVTTTFLGAGAYNHFIPSGVDYILQRSEFSTAYTPYQPEISQGTLRVIYEFQTMVCALLGMDVANASMYDGATAAAEAALMSAGQTRRNMVLISGAIHPGYLDVIRTYCWGYGLEVEVLPFKNHATDMGSLTDELLDRAACMVLQVPNFFGTIEEAREIAARVKSRGALMVAVVNPISLGILESPGEWGADIVAAEGQPMGMGLSFGGPYLGLLACRKGLMRRMPGRIVGKTLDREGKVGYCLTLQAREQHIRREKATSNICSNEALCALAATLYLSLMGPSGVERAALLSHQKALKLAEMIGELEGFEILSRGPFFNEFLVRCPRPVSEINDELLGYGILGGFDLAALKGEKGDTMLICATEQITDEEIDSLVSILGDLS